MGNRRNSGGLSLGGITRSVSARLQGRKRASSTASAAQQPQSLARRLSRALAPSSSTPSSSAPSPTPEIPPKARRPSPTLLPFPSRAPFSSINHDVGDRRHSAAAPNGSAAAQSPPEKQDGDAFFDARSSITGLSAAPRPHSHDQHDLQQYAFPSLGVPESVLSFGSLGPPTELIVTGVAGPGRKQLPANFDVFAAVRQAQRQGNMNAEEQEAEAERRHKAELIKYYNHLVGCGSASSLSIGAEGIDLGSTPLAGSSGARTPAQYTITPPATSSRKSGDALFRSLPVSPTIERGGDREGRYLGLGRSAAAIGTAPSGHELPGVARAGPPDPAAAPVEPAAELGPKAGFISTWLASVKPAPIADPASATVALAPGLQPSATNGAGAGGSGSASAADPSSAVPLDGSSGAMPNAGSTGAPSSLSIVTIHDGALASQPTLQPSQQPQHQSHHVQGPTSPQLRALGGASYLRSSAKGNSNHGSGSGSSGAGAGVAFVNGHGVVGAGGSSGGARTPVLMNNALLSSGTRFAQPLDANGQVIPSSSSKRGSTSSGGGGGGSSSPMLPPPPHHSRSPTQASAPGTQRVRRQPPLPMSADGAPPRFGSVSTATMISGFTELTSVSRR